MNDFEKNYQKNFLKITEKLSKGHGPEFLKAVNNLPELKNLQIDFDQDRISIRSNGSLANQFSEQIYQSLLTLKPWRKGPFHFLGHDIDTEWESYLKWNRLKPYLPDLKNKVILDVGASSGYYMFRMFAHDPYLILGVDPSVLFYHQFLAINKYLKAKNLFYLPSFFEELEGFKEYFDIIFSMGILYHQRSPFEALDRMRRMLKPDGILILEGMYIPGEEEIVLVPKDRYAKMRNVYFIPTLKALYHWLNRSGFYDLDLISVSKTTESEQHQTSWIRGESLKDFLDPQDDNLTIEGYPAPRRFMMMAKAKKL